MFKLKIVIPPEETEQIWLADWLRAKKILFTSSANGGSRHPAEGRKFKRMGVRKGWPDIEIPYARKSYHGLYIELKRVEGSVISVDQKICLRQLTENGYLATVAFGFNEARQIVDDYLHGEGSFISKHLVKTAPLLRV